MKVLDGSPHEGEAGGSNMMRNQWRRECESQRARARGQWIVGTMLAVGLFAGGCDARHVLGNVSGTGGAGDSGAFIPGAPIDAGYPGDVSGLGVRQSWTGYVEMHQFPSGSDAVRVSFSSDSSGVVVGTVTLGSGTPPSPATDPNAYYPPGVPDGFWSEAIEGFPFTIANGTLVGSRLRFNIWETELMNSWCALQAPVPGSYHCLPDWASQGSMSGTDCSQTSPTGQVVHVSCPKLWLCEVYPVCTCTAAGCTQDFGVGMSLDVSLSDTRADGSFSGTDGVPHNVHFTKDP
jgi:hypothetical protein